MAMHHRQRRLAALLLISLTTLAAGCGTSRVYELPYETLAAEFPCDRVAEEPMTTCHRTEGELRIEHEIKLKFAYRETAIIVEPETETRMRVRVDQEDRVDPDVWLSPYFILGVFMLPGHILDTNGDQERFIIEAINEAAEDDDAVFWDVGYGRIMAGDFGPPAP